MGKVEKFRPSTEEEIRLVYVKSSMGFLRATAETVSIVQTAIEFIFDECDLGRPWARRGSTADGKIYWECFQYLHNAFGSGRGSKEGVLVAAKIGPRTQE